MMDALDPIRLMREKRRIVRDVQIRATVRLEMASKAMVRDALCFTQHFNMFS